MTDVEFIELIEVASSLKDELDMNKVLNKFHQRVSAAKFSGLPNEDIMTLFCAIWKIFLAAAADTNPTTRLATYRTTGAFLIRITPYYPELILRSFAEVALLATIDIKSSAVIASSYAYLSTYVARPNLIRFLSSVPVFHHFSTSDSAFAEHIAAIVSHLGHLGMEFMKNLLHYFLDRYEESNARHVMKAIDAVVAQQPNMFLRELVSSVDVEIPGFMSLVSFLVCAHQDEIGDLDLMPVVKVAIATIGKEGVTMSQMDCALQVVTVSSPSFSVSVEDAGDGMFVVKAKNETEEVQATLSLQKVASRPAVYMLPLPIEVLKPKQNESSLIVDRRLKTLAKCEAVSVLDTFDIFEPYLMADYCDATAGALRWLSRCINKFLNHVPEERLSIPIRKAMFSKTISWFHSVDVLGVVRKTDMKLLRKVLGDQCFHQMIDTVVGFYFCENERLSSHSSSVLQSMITTCGFETVMDMVMKRTDLFDRFVLMRSISIVTKLLAKGNAPTQSIDRFVEQLVESFSYYHDDLDVISAVFQLFCGCDFCHTQLKELTNIAMCVVHCSISAVSGTNTFDFPELDESLLTYYGNVVKMDMAHRNTDIITEPSLDYREFIKPMGDALRFLFARSGVDCTVVAMSAFPLFPLECSQYFASNWTQSNDKMRNVMISCTWKHLPHVSDDRVMAIWCRLYTEHGSLDRTLDMSRLREFLVETAKCYLVEDVQVAVHIGTAYVEFLRDCAKDEVIQFLKSLPRSSFEHFLNASDVILEFARENLPDLTTDYAPAQGEIVPSSTEPDVSKEQLPEEITDDNIQTLFERYVRRADARLVTELLYVASKMNVKVSIDELEFPPSIVSTVASVMAKTQPNALDARKAMKLCRTSWRPLAITSIQADHDTLLDHVASAEKVTKNDIIDLISLVSDVQFDRASLLKLSLKLFKECESKRRFHTTVRLLAVVLVLQETVSRPLVTEFITKIAKNFEHVDGPACSIITLTCAQKVPADQAFLTFVKSLLDECGGKTTGYGRLQQILVSVSSVPALVPRGYASKMPTLIESLMRSVVPSRYMAGLRLLEQANLSITASKLEEVVRPSVNILIDRFVAMCRFPCVPDLQFRAVMSIFVKKGVDHLQSVIIRSFPKALVLETSHAGFASAVRLCPWIVRLVDAKSELFWRVMPVCRNLICDNAGFVVGMRCLNERTKRVKNSDRETTMMEALVPWIASANEQVDYGLTERIGTWLTLVDTVDSRLGLEVVLPMIRGITRFSSVFVNIAKFAATHKDYVIFTDAVRNSAAYRQNKCEQRVLMMLGLVDTGKLLKLADFAEDCDDAEKLFNEIKPADFVDE